MKPTEVWTKYEPHGEDTHQDRWDGFGQEDPFRKWEGTERYEILVPVSSLVRWVCKLFGKKK